MPLDILALAILPHLTDGRPSFQFGGCIVDEALLRGLAAQGHRVRAVAEALPAAGDEIRAAKDVPGVAVEPFAIDYVRGREPLEPDLRARLQDQLGAALERTLDDGWRPDVVLLGRESQAWYAPEVLRGLEAPIACVAQGVPTAALESGMYPPAHEADFVGHLSSLDLVIAVADHLAQTLRARGIDRILTIPNAIDHDLFRPLPDAERMRRRLDIDAGAPVVVYTSGILTGKRPRSLVASAARVLEAVPEARYVFASADYGIADLKAAAAEHGVEHAFRWLGEIDRAEMPLLLSACDVMAHTSGAEGAPLTYGEAHACGLPVIATDIPAAREAIDHGRTGLLYPVRDTEALSAHTIALLRDRDRREAMGRAARAEAVHRGGLGRWVERYSGALLEVASAAVVR
ncbi:MAG TPA: glycosyltransferase family 4 protein [Solirubrobacteraceae bacterium]|jgi:glycosyltransferase involved in cell wall biosynthesis